MTEAEARKHFGDDAQKVEGSLEVRTPNQGTNFLGPAKVETEVRFSYRESRSR